MVTVEVASGAGCDWANAAPEVAVTRAAARSRARTVRAVRARRFGSGIGVQNIVGSTKRGTSGSGYGSGGSEPSAWYGRSGFLVICVVPGGGHELMISRFVVGFSKQSGPLSPASVVGWVPPSGLLFSLPAFWLSMVYLVKQQIRGRLH